MPLRTTWALATRPTRRPSCLAEVEGLVDGVDLDAGAIGEIGREHGATEVRLAGSEAEREKLWKGRKTAFGAIAQMAPDYYLHDTVVPRAALADVLDQVYEIAAGTTSW